MLGVRVLIKKKREKEDRELEGANVQEVKTSDEYEEDEKQKRSRLLLILATPFLAIVAIILFILTQDMTLPMIMIDWWTLAHAILFVGTVLCYIFAYRNEKDEDRDDEEPIQNTTVA